VRLPDEIVGQAHTSRPAAVGGGGVAVATIVRLANFVAPTSGGIRTYLDATAAGYRAAGHRAVLVVPGAVDRFDDPDHIELRGPRLPGGPYRALTDVARVRAVVESQQPDRLEVSDKLTLRSLGPWARDRGIPTVLVSHERIDAILRPRLPRPVPLGVVANITNRRLAAAFDTVVCASGFAADEWRRIGAENVTVVPLGVDLATFRPRPRPQPTRVHVELELVCVGRLSSEKRPDLALAAVRELRAGGRDARLTFVGAGPLADRLARHATVRGHVGDRDELASILAAADLAICPCPYETFGLAAAEALACGTAVVVPGAGALPELVAAGPAGCGAVADGVDGAALAAAAARLLDVPPDVRRAAARRAAERFPWSATVAGLLAAHRLGDERQRTAATAVAAA
jgi:alpha-1,6-mannosyltransferase